MVVCSTETLPDPVSQDRFDAARRFTSSSDADRWGDDRYAQWTDELSEPQVDAVQSYLEDSARLNNPFRTGNSEFTNQEDYFRAVHLDSALRNAPALSEDVIAYRSVSSKFIDFPEGTVFVDKGYTSTTLVQSFADDLAAESVDDVVVEIFISEGTPSSMITTISDMGQSEILLTRGSRFRVRSNDGSKIVLEVIL